MKNEKINLIYNLLVRGSMVLAIVGTLHYLEPLMQPPPTFSLFALLYSLAILIIIFDIILPIVISSGEYVDRMKKKPSIAREPSNDKHIKNKQTHAK